jgi:hypothetical protein
VFRITILTVKEKAMCYEFTIDCALLIFQKSLDDFAPEVQKLLVDTDNVSLFIGIDLTILRYQSEHLLWLSQTLFPRILLINFRKDVQLCFK